MAMGVCSFGGVSIGLLGALGGLAISTGIAVGGCAVGTIAIGGGAVGILAQGGGAFGMYTRSGRGVSLESAAVFNRHARLFGAWPGRSGPVGNPLRLFLPAVIPLALAAVLSAVIGLIAFTRMNNEDGDQDKDASMR
jgi:hypothetical protein